MEALISLVVSGFIVYLLAREDYSPSSNNKGISSQPIFSFMHAVLTSNGKPKHIHLKDLDEHQVGYLSEWDRMIYRSLKKYNMDTFEVSKLDDEDLHKLVAIPEKQGEAPVVSLTRDIAKNILKERVSSAGIINQ